MQLNKIHKDDLIFTGDIEDDRTNTYLSLVDYDWMNYTLSTRFVIKKYGVLNVEFSYCGANESAMKVIRSDIDVSETYEYVYSTNIFKKHIISFLIQHIASWEDDYAFNGEDCVIQFYNDVIEYGKLKH